MILHNNNKTNINMEWVKSFASAEDFITHPYHDVIELETTEKRELLERIYYSVHPREDKKTSTKKDKGGE